MSKLHIKKGDTVYVNSGEDKGKTGRVLKVLVDKKRAIVEGINMVSKSTKPNAKNPQGGIVKQEASIHISNLNPVDPKTGKATRVGRKLSADGKTIIIVSHDLDFCGEYADRCGMFADGKLIAVNNSRDFFTSNNFYTTTVAKMSRSTIKGAVKMEDNVCYLKNV